MFALDLTSSALLSSQCARFTLTEERETTVVVRSTFVGFLQGPHMADLANVNHTVEEY